MAEVVQITGLKELQEAMKRVPLEMQGKVAVDLLRKVGKPMLEDARARAPVLKPENARSGRTPGKLRKNIYIARARDSTKTDPLVVIRVRRRGKADDPQNAFYWLFQEFGTSKQAATPLLRPAFEAKKQEVLSALQRLTAEEVEKAARKVAKISAYYRR